MLKGRSRIAATTALLSAAALLAASSASATTLGSNLVAAPNAGICATASGSAEASCTYAQLQLSSGHHGRERETAGERSVVTRWRVRSGISTPATTSVKLRPRLIEGDKGTSLSGGTPYVDLPLAQPGVHEFPARLPIPKFTLVGLDVLVTGSGGEASAPIANDETGVGSIWKWTPALSDGLAPMPVSEENTELLFNAVVEPDRDGDGFGDKTQDRCPEDPTRQSHCDHRPPRTKLTYAVRQDFLSKGPVVVRLRTNETARVFANGQIDIGHHVSWGIYGVRKDVGKGNKTRFSLRVPAKAREVAAHAAANGQRVVAKVFVVAVDEAGNESGTTVATIKPKR
jgi:hypothetical protein